MQVTETRESLGLIAGMGELPRTVAKSARSKGYRVVAVALDPLADESLEQYVDEIKSINVGKLNEIIGALKSSGIRKAVMAGKVPKALLYKGRVVPDIRAVKLLFFLKDRSDDSIMLAITREFEKDDIHIMNINEISSDIMAPEGVLTKGQPSNDEWKDISFGWTIAKEMGRLDIGQTVVIKDRAVMSVEAIEGTDEAIRRGGLLAEEGAVVVKVGKPSQDMRFDVPTVGLKTLNIMQKVHARVLAVEAGVCIIIDRDEFINQADNADISVVGCRFAVV